MDIKSIAKQALERLKKYTNFPKSGIIAGGSISNIVWEIVSGNKAVINDIDVFIYESEIDAKILSSNYLDNNTKLSYMSSETVYDEDYRGLKFTSNPKEYYQINKSEHVDIWNFVYYNSNVKGMEVIINSFDINCTQIGYSIDEDKFYWTKEFEEFLKTGELKLTNLLSPHHSIVRICKKEEELNAKLDSFEFSLISYAIRNCRGQFNKRNFSDRYLEISRKYYKKISKYFYIERDKNAQAYLKGLKSVDINLYHFESNSLKFSTDLAQDKFSTCKIYSLNELLFYSRNIIDKTDKLDYWDKLNFLYTRVDYIDITPSDDDVKMLRNLIFNAPKSIEKLKGLKISEQLRIVKKILSAYTKEPNIAIAILEKIKIDPNKDLDDKDVLMLELLVRKELLLITSDKIDGVLGIKEVKEGYILGDSQLPKICGI